MPLLKAYPVDRAWFLARLREKKLSIRKLAKLIGRDPSSVSRITYGRQLLHLEDAIKIARILNVTLYELLRRMGREPSTEGMILPVIGSVNDSLHITICRGKHASIPSMPLFDQGAVGLICDDSASLFYGWIFAYIPAAVIESTAIGRLSVVHHATAGLLIRFVKPGLHAGKFDLTGFSGQNLPNVDISAASPVLHIRAAQIV